MHSSIYYELRSHNRYEVWGRKLLIAAVTFAVSVHGIVVSSVIAAGASHDAG